MRSEDQDWTGRTISLADLGAAIAARKAALKLPEPPRNAGENRTASKRALLAAVRDMGGEW